MASVRITLLRGVLMTILAIGPALWSTPATADAAGNYKAKCASCHGADGKGETAMGKKFGLKDLASPKSLKPEEIKDLVGYIRSLARK